MTGKGSDQDLAEIIIAERKYPSRFAYRPDPDPKLHQLGLAGADVVLLPSSLGFRGTNAIAAMRYGTLPIVKTHGGVHQLVSDYDPPQRVAPALSITIIPPWRFGIPSDGQTSSTDSRKSGKNSRIARKPSIFRGQNLPTHLPSCMPIFYGTDTPLRGNRSDSGVTGVQELQNR